jgi:hypothetical protein
LEVTVVLIRTYFIICPNANLLRQIDLLTDPDGKFVIGAAELFTKLEAYEVLSPEDHTIQIKLAFLIYIKRMYVDGNEAREGEFVPFVRSLLEPYPMSISTFDRW